jgi:hypothetical protein
VFFPEKNTVFLMLWRGVLYISVVFVLTPSVLRGVNQLLHVSCHINSEKILRCRKATMISIIFYEFFIVQNILRDLIQWSYHYVG